MLTSETTYFIHEPALFVIDPEDPERYEKFCACDSGLG
jgi:hypothetical protein